MAEVYEHTEAFRGAVFRDCDLRGVRIVSSFVDGLVVSGFSGAAGPVVVDDVDVSGYVSAELDRRHPERVRVRAARSAAELRSAWAELDELWDATLARAGRLPEATLHERVHGEWSLTETLRHLAFAVDTWVGGWLHGEERPFSPLGVPPTDLPLSEWPGIGLDPAARPTSAEATALFADARRRVRAEVEGVSDDALDEPRTASPVPAWGEETHAVRSCLRTLLEEFCQHRRFAERDLADLVQG
jgi:hypothetical protein